MTKDYFTSAISRHIWDSKYRYRHDDQVVDRSVDDTWRRVAQALASIESHEQERWAQRFYQALRNFKFLPGGRILAGAGTAHEVTLFNCFVMGVIDDSLDGIFDGLKEGALTMQQGGGVGYDFSSLRPRGSVARRVGGIASGPVSFMRIWDSMCGTLLSTGARRGAMMATLRCDHPDIEEFIEAKQDSTQLRHFNLSVLVSDAFMEAVRGDQEWPLVFPHSAVKPDSDTGRETILRQWSGGMEALPCVVMKRVRARALWDKLMRANYDYAEPGVLFIDRINRYNNLWYCEHISATNPCGEIPLPPYGACDLGAINVTQFVQQPFTPQATLDWQGIKDTVSLAVRMLDNVIELSRFPLPQQARQARDSRRIGLGFTGLADALMMLGLRYGEGKALELAAKVMEEISHSAYRSAIALASEKGSFPLLDKDKYLQGEFVKNLPEDIQQGIAAYGIRNSHLTAIAPTGTISLLANNISSGIEPLFDYHYRRRVLELDGSYSHYEVVDYAYQLWRQTVREAASLPHAFVDAHGLSPQDHVAMQAVIQPYVDNAISKTINIPEDFDFGAFKHIYELAYDKGLKGCTTFRPNPVTGEVLQGGAGLVGGAHCCDLEREAD